jgi:WD40 repeat protein
MIRIAITATETEPAQVRSFVSAVVVIGRGDRCDLVLRAPGVSASHCRLSRMDGVEGAYVLEDLGSTYGTYVNGARVDRPVLVSSRDAIAIGQHAVRIETDPSQIPTLAPPPAPSSVPTIVSTVEHDEWHAHFERFDGLATAWDGHGRPKRELLRGTDLREGTAWLRAGRGRRPAPRPLHRDFVAASTALRRNRTLAIVGSFAAITAAIVIAFAVRFRDEVTALASSQLANASPVATEPEALPTGPVDAVAVSHDATTIAALVESSRAIEDPEQRVMLQAEIARIGVQLPFFAEPLWSLQSSAHETLQGVRAAVLREHDAPVTAIAVDPRGRWIASGSRDHTAKLWDLRAPAPTRALTLHGHVGAITALEISPDGRWLLSASDDRTLRRWDLSAQDPGATGLVLRAHETAVSRLAFDASGRWAVSGDGSGALVIWDIATDDPTATAQRRPAHEGPVTDLAPLPTSTAFISAGDDRIARLWRIEGERVQSATRFEGAISGITRLEVSKSGRWLATACDDGLVLLWDLRGKAAARTPVELAGHEGSVNDLAITPDEHWLVTGSDDDTLRVWDLQAKDPSVAGVVLARHTGDVTGVRVAANGTKIVSSAMDNTLRVWDLTKKDRQVDEYALHGHTAAITGLAMAPDGLVAVTGSEDSTVRVWDVLSRRGGAGGKTLRGAASIVADTAVDAERLLVTGGEGRVEIWALFDPARMPAPLRLQGLRGLVNAAALDPKGRWIAAGSENGEIALWSSLARDGESPARLLTGHEGAVNRIAFTPDGTRLVSVGSDRSVRVWPLDGDAPAVVHREHADEVHELAITRDGRWAVTASLEGVAIRWDLAAATAPVLLRGHEDEILALAVSPDGKLAVTGSADRRARVWDLATGKSVHVLRGHDDGVTAVAFSGDGRRIATGSRDERILVWNLDSPHPDESPRELAGHEQSITDLAFARDAELLVSASNDATVRLWQLSAGAVTSLSAHDLPVQEVLVAGNTLVSSSYDGSARIWPLSADALATRICEAVGAPVPDELRFDLFGGSAPEPFCAPASANTE